jgi:hypothetical protein
MNTPEMDLAWPMLIAAVVGLLTGLLVVWAFTTASHCMWVGGL